MSQIEIPGFEILERIGAGGMATVWKARQLSLDRIVAIKILYSKFTYDPANLQQFKSEAQAAAKLKHPGIVQVYDASAADDLYYFVMEYVAGYTVGDWVRRRGFLKERDALLVTECVASALQYAWNTAQIIHCDIKPDNILVDDDGTVKVSDLGLARTLTTMAVESADDEVMGTPPYMSPEQIRGDGELDLRADIYALGAMLYHLLTGSMPFDGYSPEEVMEMQLSAMIPDAMEVNPEVSRAACWLLERMLAKNAEDRQESWDQVLEDIARVKNHLRPLGVALPEGASTMDRCPERTKAGQQQMDLWRRRSPVSLRLALVAVLLVVLIGGLFAWMVQERARRGQVPPPAPLVLPVREAAPRPAVPDPEPVRPVVVPAPVMTLEAQAGQRLAEADRFAREEPAALAQIVERYQQVVALGVASTTAVARERLVLAQAALEREERIHQVLAELEAQAFALAGEKKFLDAARLYENYAGVLAVETRDERLRMAAAFRGRVNTEVAPTEPLLPSGQDVVSPGPQGDAVLSQVAAVLVAQGAQPAQQALLEALWQKRLVESADTLRLLAVLAGAAGVDERIMRSYGTSVGREVTVFLNAGATRLVVERVSNQRVHGRVLERTGPGAAIEFGVGDLSYRERLARLGDDSDATVALAKGLMALQAHNLGFARQFFTKSDPLLGPHLLRQLDAMEANP